MFHRTRAYISLCTSIGVCLQYICVCVCVCVHICVCAQKTSAPELLNQSLVTLTQMQAPSNHQIPAISGRLSGHISRVVIRSSARFQGDAGLAVRPQDFLRGPQSSSNLSPAGAAAAFTYTCMDRAYAQEVILAPFLHQFLVRSASHFTSLNKSCTNIEILGFWPQYYYFDL